MDSIPRRASRAAGEGSQTPPEVHGPASEALCRGYRGESQHTAAARVSAKVRSVTNGTWTCNGLTYLNTGCLKLSRAWMRSHGLLGAQLWPRDHADLDLPGFGVAPTSVQLLRRELMAVGWLSTFNPHCCTLHTSVSVFSV